MLLATLVNYCKCKLALSFVCLWNKWWCISNSRVDSSLTDATSSEDGTKARMSKKGSSPATTRFYRILITYILWFQLPHMGEEDDRADDGIRGSPGQVRMKQNPICRGSEFFSWNVLIPNLTQNAWNINTFIFIYFTWNAWIY